MKQITLLENLMHADYVSVHVGEIDLVDILTSLLMGLS